MGFLQKKLSSQSLKERILFCYLVFLVLFFGITIISYYFLPEGLLKNKNPLQDWETSKNTFISTLQIFFYNQLSVIVIIFGSLFGKKKEKEINYFSIGYLAFFTQICINGVVLGTWSFSMGTEAVPLISRITRTFDLLHRAGLWEMSGQLLVTCAAAHISTVLTNGKNTITKSFRDIHLSKTEKLVFFIGLGLMLTGAVVESIAIGAL
ncbi:MAG: hypothetical protein K0R50_4210 [Eubacterium sp.]|jgi:hypothetical protein|nr:hypothetical protein [Eubacterium sp.]